MRRNVVIVAGAAAVAVLGIGQAALAETYNVSGVFFTVASVGTDGSDSAPFSFVGVSHGGCATSDIAVAIGESNRSCPGLAESHGYLVAVGLLGADAYGGGLVAVSDTGDVHSGCFNLLGCWYVGTAASGTGSAQSVTAAASGTGPASAADAAVSGTNDAHATGVYQGGPGEYYDGTGVLAVSGLGNATASDGVAVSGIGTARSKGCSGDPARDATSTAVSVTGNAYGCHSASVTGEAGPGAP